MRIISQDGKCDYPYENSTLFIDYMDGRVIKIVPSTGYKDSNIATYSTEEKATKAMEMLREQYSRIEIIKTLAFGTCKHMEESLKPEELKDILEKYINMEVFQFPRDDEIEV